MWVTNGKTWYSEDEVAQLKAENEKLKAYIVWLKNNSTIKKDNAILDNKEVYDAMLQFPE